MSQYVHDRWGPGEGFPRGPVYAIAQTTDGYLWIGTQAGLVRFDGLQFVLMRDPSRIAGYSSVIGLSANPDGSLWIRTQDMKLLRYRDGTFSDPFKNQRQNSNLTAMSRSKGDELLTVRLQLGAFAFRGGGLSLLARATGVPRSPVLSIAMTGDDTYWLGTRGAGLFELKAGATKAITGGLPDSKINCLLPDRTGNLWIGTDNGIARWDGAEVTTRNLPAELTKSQILTMIRDRDSNLWLGTDSRGVLRFNAEGVSSLDSAEGETRNAVMALFEDREGDLWIGSANSIERLRYSPFVTYSAPEGLPTDGSNPIFTDAEDRTWFAPVSGGLWWMKNGVHGSIREAGLPNDIVYSVAGGKSELWVGRQRGGLTHLQRKGDGFTTVTYTKSDGLAQNSVYSVYLTRSGAIWAGTLSGGVSRLERETFTNYTIAQGLASNTVASMLESADGAMWFATPSGLSTFLNGLWHTYSTAQGLPSDNINCLLEDSAGILWAGTTAGLAFRASSEFAIPIHAPAAVREQVLGLAEDAFGFLWLATANHVLRVNRGKLLQGTLADGDLVEYGTADGLRGTEGVKRDPSVMRDSLGRIWISLNRGISVVDPARLAGRSAPAIPQIQTIAADGVAINITSSVRVPAGQQRIVISYAGLSLSIPERVRFRYRLEGFDRGWSETTTERQAVYTNLWPGTYSFRVLACNPSGVWSSQEAAITFSVEPAFWQRWWFSVAVVFACILAAVALYRSRLRQATARLHLRFEERLAERTRIARDLHDTLLQSFHGLILRFQAVQNMLPERPTQARDALEIAIDRTAQAITEGRDAVEELRGGGMSNNDLVETLTALGHELASDRTDTEPRPSTQFRVLVEGVPRPVNPRVRDDLYRIAREAVRNAFRHARASQIEVDIRYDKRMLGLRVRDDGVGMDPTMLAQGRREGHWGLPGMRERAISVGGQFELWSELRRGTEVDVTIPGAIAYGGLGNGSMRVMAEEGKKR